MLSVTGALLVSAPAHAVDVKVHVQAPYELDPSLLVRFDLDRLHAQNVDPVYADRFAIPYDVIEPLIASKLAEAVDGVRHFHITCKTVLCPDTDVDVTILSTFSFTQKNQPKIESVGPASHDTFRITLDTQVAVGVDLLVETETGSGRRPRFRWG
ncbi:hypothetical protein [Paraliomyxa miuraensis]|uniref:hypothetical protein n=1 Tax=Paraliomyxa miuraensis TaxID=376150 RepID=UPI0022545C92|nr:hypothetical protein [Paraliomyxa miuraensis]MCX4244881.1 hypothetical protein [Paraliomyxa miuraensis]